MQWVSLFFALSGAAMVIGGIGFLLATIRQPDIPDKLNSRLLNRHLDMVDRPRRIERFIYRHHRLFGSAIVVGALTVMGVVWLFRKVWLGGSGGSVTALLVRALIVAVFVIGIIVLVRPSALKGVEALANRWIQPFPAIVLSFWQIGAVLLVAGVVCVGVAARMAGAY